MTIEQQRALAMARARQRAAAAPQDVPQRTEQAVDPTEGMSAFDKVLAGTGMGLSRMGRGVGQAVGLVSQEDIDRAREAEGPLAATTEGKVGNVAGTVLGLLPAAFIPGANTLAGAAAIGAGSGALATEGGIKDRLTSAAGGALGGVGGIAIGRGAAAGIKALGDRAAKQGVENEVSRAAAREAVSQGRVLPPSEMADSAPGRAAWRLAESLAGKAATGQKASGINQEVTNNAIRKQFGLKGKGEIKETEVEALKEPLFKIYDDAKSISPDAKKAVDLWRQANSDARDYRRFFMRSADPSAQKAANAAESDAQTWLQFVESEAVRVGKPDVAKDLAHARVSLGKIGTLEDALNEVRGDVSARSLKQAMDRGVPVSGAMRDAARFAKGFEGYAQNPKSAAQPGVGNLGAMLSILAGPVKGAALLGAPALTRSTLLSRPVQRMAMPSADPGATRKALAEALRTDPALRAYGLSGAVSQH